MLDLSRESITKFVLATFFLSVFALLFTPFFSPIILAGIFALAIHPLMKHYLTPEHVRSRWAVALVLLSMFFLFLGPLILVGYKFFASISEVSRVGVRNTEFYQRLSIVQGKLLEFIDQLMVRFHIHEDAFSFTDFTDQHINAVLNTVFGLFASLLNQVPSLTISLFVFVAALYFFLARAGEIKLLVRRQGLLAAPVLNRFIDLLQRASYNTMVTSVIIGLVQATFVGVGSLVFSAGDPVVVFVITFISSFIPVLGAGPVSLVLASIRAVMGEYGDAIGLVVVALVAGTTDNVIRPYLISSGEEDLHPVLSLLAIIGALMLFGMPGLLLGPVIATVAVKIVPALFEPVTADATDLSKKET